MTQIVDFGCRDMVTFHLRPWSFEGRAVLRAFHALRWLYNASNSSKEQVRVLKLAFTRLFAAQANRGAMGEPPLVFREVVSLVSEVAAENGMNEVKLLKILFLGFITFCRLSSRWGPVIQAPSAAPSMPCRRPSRRTPTS